MGDFLVDHLDEIAGGRIFALEKANNSLRPIFIGSLWRRCATRLGVAEVSIYPISRDLLCTFLAKTKVQTQFTLYTVQKMQHGSSNVLF